MSERRPLTARQNFERRSGALEIGGKALAFQDLCIHRGSKLSLGRIESNELVCAYHGWTYDGEGVCVKMPAHPEQKPALRARVRNYNVREKYGFVWICLGSSASDIGEFPEWDDNSFRKIYCGPYEAKASGPRLVENFQDVAHLPLVN